MSSFTFQMYYVVFISVLVLILFAFLLVLIVKLLKKNRVITSAIVIAADLVLLSCSVFSALLIKPTISLMTEKYLRATLQISMKNTVNPTDLMESMICIISIPITII